MIWILSLIIQFFPRYLTWFEVGLHIGQDRVAWCQVTDTHAHKIFVNVRLPEQLVELRKEEGEMDRVRGENGEREEMINESGNELHAIMPDESNSRNCTLSPKEERLPFKLGCREEAYRGGGAQIDI